MSTATTLAGARAEFLADLKRLKPTRAGYMNALESQIQALAQHHQKRAAKIAAAQASFAELQKDALEAHVDAELAALGDE